MTRNEKQWTLKISLGKKKAVSSFCVRLVLFGEKSAYILEDGRFLILHDI